MTVTKKSDRDFFTGEYKFTGIHGKYVEKLTLPIIENEIYKTNIKIIEYNHKIYTIAPMIGFLYKRKASKSIDGEIVKKIPEGQIIKYSDRAKEVLRLILLLDSEYEPDEQKRIDKAFRYFCEDENDFKLFEDYMRGGIEVLYEKLFNDNSEPFAVTENLIVFMQEFQEMFNSRVGEEDILNLCAAFTKNGRKNNSIRR